MNTSVYDSPKSEKGLHSEEGQNDMFQEPLGTNTSGRLVFASGASNVGIRTDAQPIDLIRATFTGPLPVETSAKDGTVTIRYRQVPLLDWFLYAVRSPAADISVNASVPWSIAVRGGVSRFTADLTALDLRGFDVAGGASHVELILPPPRGTIQLRVNGGASNLAVHRPAGTAVRIQVSGGISKLHLDGGRHGAIGGGFRTEIPGDGSSEDRYDLVIGGGASQLTVDIH